MSKQFLLFLKVGHFTVLLPAYFLNPVRKRGSNVLRQCKCNIFTALLTVVRPKGMINSGKLLDKISRKGRNSARFTLKHRRMEIEI